MQSWIRVNVGVPDEPKVIGIADVLEIEPELALGHVVATWCRIGEHAPEGDLSSISDLVLERWAGWRGERGRYAIAFREAFMQDGRMPGWDRLQGKLIDLAQRDRARKDGVRAENPRKILGSSTVTVQDVTGQDVTTHHHTTTTAAPATTSATRKTRESRPRLVKTASEATWLTPVGAAWEAVNGKGSFPYGQAAREFKPLVDAGHDPSVIARRLAWYLRVRGLDAGDPDPEVIARTRFTPNLRDFRLRFARFNPDRTDVSGLGGADETGATLSAESWLREPAAAWEARYDRGSFPYDRAARDLKPLVDAGHTAGEIARRLAWYLENKGSEVVLDRAMLDRRHFAPSLKDFRQRFGQFDPSAPSEAA